MAIDYCQKHGHMFDRDYDTECPMCASEPEAEWVIGPFSSRLMRGDVCVAVIIPMPPRPWNNHCRFKVDGRGMKGPINVRTLDAAVDVAINNAFVTS